MEYKTETEKFFVTTKQGKKKEITFTSREPITVMFRNSHNCPSCDYNPTLLADLHFPKPYKDTKIYFCGIVEKIVTKECGCEKWCEHEDTKPY